MGMLLAMIALCQQDRGVPTPPPPKPGLPADVHQTTYIISFPTLFDDAGSKGLTTEEKQARRLKQFNEWSQPILVELEAAREKGLVEGKIAVNPTWNMIEATLKPQVVRNLEEKKKAGLLTSFDLSIQGGEPNFGVPHGSEKMAKASRQDRLSGFVTVEKTWGDPDAKAGASVDDPDKATKATKAAMKYYTEIFLTPELSPVLLNTIAGNSFDAEVLSVDKRRWVIATTPAERKRFESLGVMKGGEAKPKDEKASVKNEKSSPSRRREIAFNRKRATKLLQGRFDVVFTQVREDGSAVLQVPEAVDVRMRGDGFFGEPDPTRTLLDQNPGSTKKVGKEKSIESPNISIPEKDFEPKKASKKDIKDGFVPRG